MDDEGVAADEDDEGAEADEDDEEDDVRRDKSCCMPSSNCSQRSAFFVKSCSVALARFKLESADLPRIMHNSDVNSDVNSDCNA